MVLTIIVVNPLITLLTLTRVKRFNLDFTTLASPAKTSYLIWCISVAFFFKNYRSHYGRLFLRHFNELDHEFQIR